MTDDRLAVDLERMRHAAADVIQFTAGMSEVDFLADRKTQAAVAMSLIVIGEAATRIVAQAPGFVASHPEWPWNAMRGLRNRAAHGYDTLDFHIVWSSLTGPIPDLLRLLEGLGNLDPRR